MIETEIFVIRHGKIDNPNDVIYGRLPGFPLSERGRQQVLALAELLKSKGVDFDVIYSSPLEKALQTAEILKNALKSKALIEVREELNDIDSSNLEGESMDVLRQFDFDYEKLAQEGFSLESPSLVLERLKKLLEEVKEKNKGQRIAFITHGDPSRILLWSLQNPNQPTPSDLRDDNYLAPAGVVVLRFNPNSKFLDFEHLSVTTSIDDHNNKNLEAS